MAESTGGVSRKDAGKSGSRAAKAGTRGSYAVGDARRQQILDTAIEHFAQWGFHASSMARIAHDCEITQGGLLHHFRSKEDLLLSVLAQSERHDVEQIFAAGPTTVVEGLEALIRLAESNTRRPGLVRMFNVLVGEAGNQGHPAHAYFLARYERVLNHTVAVLESGVTHGELSPDIDVLQLAQEQLAVMDGLQFQWALDPSSFDMPARLRAYLDRLLKDITVDGTGLPESG